MASILPLAKTQFVDSNGIPLALGTVGFYIPNTLTPKDTYQDLDATIPNANPVPLDAGGRAIIVGIGRYRQIVKDALGNTIWDQNTVDVTDSAQMSFIQAGTGAVTRTGQAKMRDTVDVRDFNAKVDGATDDQAAITNAMASGAARVLITGAVGASTVIGSQITIPAGCQLIMADGISIKPSVNMASLVKLHAGAEFYGKINTSGVAFTGIALDINGDDNNDATPFRLHTKTYFDAIIVGGLGAGTGTAVKLHADGVANARVMGVRGNARIYGFEYGVYLRQSSADLSKFVNANDIDIYSSETLRPLYMESSHVNGYGIDGNRLRAQSQPRAGTTVPAMTICGQDNNYDLLPYDWSTVVGTAPFALSVSAGTRNSTLLFWTDFVYVQNNSTDASLIFINPFDTGAIRLNALRALASDNVLRILGSSLRLDNNKFLGALTTAAVFRNLLGLNGSDDLVIQGVNVAGKNVVIDTANATGLVAVRSNGTNKMFVGANGIQAAGPLRPATDAGASQASCSLYAGSGAPNNANGVDGDYYFRSDTPGTANQRIYVKAAGAWNGVV